MPLFLPPPADMFRDIGDLTRVMWDGDPGSLGYARIRSWSGASFAGITSGDTFSVVLGGSPVAITPAGTETSPADMIATINATVGSTVAYLVSSRIELRHATSVGVSGMSAASFAKIGLANSTRTPGANQTSTLAPPDVAGDEVELLSQPITVQPGANVMSLDVILTNTTSLAGAAQVMLSFENDSIGAPSGLFDGVMASQLEGAAAPANTNDPRAIQRIRAAILSTGASVPSGTIRMGFPPIELPPHRKVVRVVVSGSYLESTSKPPVSPPSVSAYVGFGAR